MVFTVEKGDVQIHCDTADELRCAIDMLSGGSAVIPAGVAVPAQPFGWKPHVVNVDQPKDLLQVPVFGPRAMFGPGIPQGVIGSGELGEFISYEDEQAMRKPDLSVVHDKPPSSVAGIQPTQQKKDT